MSEKKEKKYLIDNPTLMAEWNWEKNNDLGLDPKMLTCGSGKKVWWKCSKGHEWQATIANRKNGNGCPYCSNQRVLIGYNDLTTINPTLAKEWNYEKNGDLKPYDVVPNSNKKVWWKCSKGHEWQTAIVNRQKTNCPYCSGKRVIEGENDFKTIHPELMEEWDFEKNINVNPSKIMSSIALKVWWKCSKGHEWKARINYRHKGTGCPICASEIQTSFPEKALYFYFSKIFEPESRVKIQGSEIDIYIKSLNLAIEYDGIYYHNRARKIILDEQKNNKIKDLGIFLIRIKEAECEYFDAINNTFYYIPKSNYSNFNNVIKSVIDFINEKFNLRNEVNIDIRRDHVEILKLYKSLEIENSVGKKYPELSKEWNVQKNGKLTPYQFAPKSSFKVWWKCQHGHEWQAVISDRTEGKGCPICSGRQLLKGYNDLATCYPLLVKEWNYEKNNNLKPDEIVAHSHKKVWWKCKHGHEWQATIISRSMNHTNCPYCSGNKVITGVNDFETWCKKNNKENLLNEFDKSKNHFKASEIFPGGDIEVWWLCPKGHSYSTQIKSRTLRNTNCPYCVHKKILPGYNDLATTHPHIAKEWDYTKNNGVLPTEVTAGSIVKKYWFICEKGHSYSSNLLNRKKGRGCPICSGRVASENHNFLLSNPELCKEWDYAKNEITPDKVTPNSSKLVWWKCENGHEWQATINNRNKGTGCPICYRNSKR